MERRARLRELELVLKGGRPWGFDLESSEEPPRIKQIDFGGKAAEEGTLQLGDLVLKVNHVNCYTTEECRDLISSAFNTLTLTVWRGSSEGNCPEPVQTISIKHRRSLSKTSDDGGTGYESNGVSWSRQRGGQYRRELSYGPPISRHVQSYQPNRRNSFSCTASYKNDNGNRNVGNYSDHHHSSDEHQRSPVALSSVDLEQPVYENVQATRAANWSGRHKHLRSERKLTKDSGYETSPQNESDYVNSDWVNKTKSLKPNTNPDMISPDGNELSDGAAELRAKSAKLGYMKVSEPLDSYKTNQCRYSSSDSISSQVSCSYYDPKISRWMGVNSAKSTPSLMHHLEKDNKRNSEEKQLSCSSSSCLSTCHSTPNLDQEVPHQKAMMVARKFKKASVYDTLASKSGLDFAPMVQKPYWEKHGSRENLLSHIRQESNQSSGSDWASSGYHSMSLHSKQSSCSTEEENQMLFAHPYNNLKESISELDMVISSPPPPHEYFYRDLHNRCYDDSLQHTSLPPPLPKLTTSPGHNDQYQNSNLSSSNSSSLTNVNGCGNVKVLVQNLNKQHAINQQNNHRGRKYRSNGTAAHDSSIFNDRHGVAELTSWSPYYKNSSRHHGSLCSETESEYNPENKMSSEPQSNSSTPLLDRLKKESNSDMCFTSLSHKSSNSFDSGAESIGSCHSSQETLKWHGSNSDLTFCVVSSKPVSSQTQFSSDRVNQSPNRYPHNTTQTTDSGNNLRRSSSSSSRSSSQLPLDNLQTTHSSRSSYVQSIRNGYSNHQGPSGDRVTSSTHVYNRQTSAPSSLSFVRPKTVESHMYTAQPVNICSNNYVRRNSVAKSNPRSPPPGQLVGHTLTVKPGVRPEDWSPTSSSSGYTTNHSRLKQFYPQNAISVSEQRPAKLHPVQGGHAVVHSSRVMQPQRHNSHSVMYYNESKVPSSRGAATHQYSSQNSRKSSVCSISDDQEQNSEIGSVGPTSPEATVSINSSVYENQASFYKVSSLDPCKKSRVTDPELKAKQKQAVLSFFERHNSNVSSVECNDDPPNRDDASVAALPVDERIAIYSNETELLKTKGSVKETICNKDNSPSHKNTKNTDCRDTSIEASSASSSPINTYQNNFQKANLAAEKSTSTNQYENVENDKFVNSENEVSPKSSISKKIISSDLWSRCSSPDLPLPPPPKTTLTELVDNNDPLPPPPTVINEIQAENFNNRKSDDEISATQQTSNSIGQDQDEGKVDVPVETTKYSEKSSSTQVESSFQSINDKNEETNTSRYHHGNDSPPPPLPSRNYRKLSPLPTQMSNNNKIVVSIKPQQREEQKLVEEVAEEPKQMLSSKTMDCSTQTTNSLSRRSNSCRSTLNTPKFIRKKRQAELECDRLSQDLVSQIDDTSLSNLLIPAPEHKTTADYIEGLFDHRIDNSQVPKKADKVLQKLGSSSDLGNMNNPLKPKTDEQPLPANSAYFTTSESKAKFLTRYNNDIVQEKNKVNNNDDENTYSKKQELIDSITKKLDILKSEQLAIRDEISLNMELGSEVRNLVQEHAKLHEFEKFKLHVEELGKIIKLLLSLSGRLARAENAISVLPKDSNPEELKTLEMKRDKLSSQYEEAKRLKECIDRRSQQVSKFLKKYLSEEEYNDYEHFVQMKSKLVVDSRDIDDKIKLGEEQLCALNKSLGRIN